MCDHNSEVESVLGCKDCDRVINRPIPKRFGKGNSSIVIPRPPPLENGDKDE